VIATALTELLGIRYPIVQAAMGYVSGPRLAAATSNAGGLGLIASATMSLAELEGAIAETAGRTTAPFGSTCGPTPRCGRTGRAHRLGSRPRRLLRPGPEPELIATLKEAGGGHDRLGRRAPARREGGRVGHRRGHRDHGGEGGRPRRLGADQPAHPPAGGRGGHPGDRGGGFFDGRGLVAALAWGAAGIAMGTRFLLTSDSPVADAVKQVYLDAGLDGTVVTRRVDGVPHRVLRTTMVDQLEGAGAGRGGGLAGRGGGLGGGLAGRGAGWRDGAAGWRRWRGRRGTRRGSAVSPG